MQLQNYFNEQQRILIVDDVKSARKIIGKLLQQLGIEHFDYASNGKEAVDIVAHGKTALVISDWNMPTMSGIELLQKLGTNKESKPIPFIMITSSSERASVIEAAKMGVSEYIVKPFSEQILKDKIESLINRYFKHDNSDTK